MNDYKRSVFGSDIIGYAIAIPSPMSHMVMHYK